MRSKNRQKVLKYEKTSEINDFNDIQKQQTKTLNKKR